jgi:hypothetical protein
MRTAAEPRAAWAEWAGWTCKEPKGFCNPDVQRLAREERKAPVGKPAGVFSFERLTIHFGFRTVVPCSRHARSGPRELQA